jgi:isopentenyl-diphosphate delta-isomerase
MEDAIERRVTQELGVRATRIGVVLPDFRYQAVDASGIRENEVCPVYVATFEGAVDPDPDEVMQHTWVDAAALADVATRTPWLLSPWSVAQIGQMDLTRIAALLGQPAGGVAAAR